LPDVSFRIKAGYLETKRNETKRAIFEGVGSNHTLQHKFSLYR